MCNRPSTASALGSKFSTFDSPTGPGPLSDHPQLLAAGTCRWRGKGLAEGPA